MIINYQLLTMQTLPPELEQLASSLSYWLATTTSQTHQWLEQTTEQSGRTLQAVAQNPMMQFIGKGLKADWLMAILGEIDLEKAQATVRQLQAQYPQETPRQIANRIMFQYAWQAGQVGLIANLIPPIAVILMGIEVAAIVKLQTQMVYQIAAAYGLDLAHPARRGEVLAIFGLSLGGGVLKTGLSWDELLPIVGPVIGASTNAILLYLLGYAACQFYEMKSESLTLTPTQSY